ncbi:hypothetical protein Aperf_G00000026673 [Anoplocephala perfoliata]
MGITFQFQSPLEVGHCIAIVGEVGKKFSLKLQSDFKAFNPDVLPSTPPSCESESLTVMMMGDNLTGLPMPVGETRPLEVTLDISGEWEVCGSTPETSSNASGFNAVRNGFRSGELFACKIYVKKDYFEVFLNSMCLSLSEHMVPVGFIQSVVIEGDCRISKMFYGETAAVEKSALQTMRPLPPRAPSCKNLTQLNLEEAVIVECVRRVPTIELGELNLTLNDPLSPLDSPSVSNCDLRRSSLDLRNTSGSISATQSLTNLHRAGSYQLVFDVSDDDDDDDIPYVPPLQRASSCFNLNSETKDIIKRPPLLIPPKSIPQGHLDLQELLPLSDDHGKIKPIRKTPLTPGPLRPLMPRAGFAIKVSHPVVQVSGALKTAIPRPTAALMSEPPSSMTSPSIRRPTQDFLANEQRVPKIQSAIPVNVKPKTNDTVFRRRSIPLSIR